MPRNDLKVSKNNLLLITKYMMDTQEQEQNSGVNDFDSCFPKIL